MIIGGRFALINCERLEVEVVVSVCYSDATVEWRDAHAKPRTRCCPLRRIELFTDGGKAYHNNMNICPGRYQLQRSCGDPSFEADGGFRRRGNFGDFAIWLTLASQYLRRRY